MGRFRFCENARKDGFFEILRFAQNDKNKLDSAIRRIYNVDCHDSASQNLAMTKYFYLDSATQNLHLNCYKQSK